MKSVKFSGLVDGKETEISRSDLSEIIDTTLLKCYVLTNDALVAPLLRLPENNCHVEESEHILKKHEKFNELIILYEKKGHHRKGAMHLLEIIPLLNFQTELLLLFSQLLTCFCVSLVVRARLCVVTTPPSSICSD